MRFNEQIWVQNILLQLHNIHYLLIKYTEDILEFRICQLAVRMIWRKVLGRTCILGGWWFGAVWTRWSLILLTHPFCHWSFSSNHLSAKSVVRQGIEWIPSSKQQRRPLPSLLSVSMFTLYVRLLPTCDAMNQLGWPCTDLVWALLLSEDSPTLTNHPWGNGAEKVIFLFKKTKSF